MLEPEHSTATKHRLTLIDFHLNMGIVSFFSFSSLNIWIANFSPALADFCAEQLESEFRPCCFLFQLLQLTPQYVLSTLTVLLSPVSEGFRLTIMAVISEVALVLETVS